MTSDGTVTTMLEACTGEPIVTVLARQSGPATLAVLERETGCWWQPPTSLLELTPAERLIARRVVLTGRHSGAAFVAAESLVVADRLPDPTALDIDRVGTSLGRLLNASGLATRRRIVEIVEARDAAVSDRLGGTRTGRLVRRTYTIASTDRTLAAVTEWIVPGRLAAHTAATGPGLRHATCPTRPRPWDRHMFAVDL
jgi:chorismate-pyruvate lyase